MGVVTYTTVNGEILSESRDGVRTDYVPNSLGSTVALLDSSQNFVAKITYWPYGEEVGTPYSGPQQMRYVGTLGCRKEGTSSRVNMRARVVDAAVGRWLRVDPMWPLERAFGYCLQNPATIVDPPGTQAIPVSPCASRPCSDEQNRCIASYCARCYAHVPPNPRCVQTCDQMASKYYRLCKPYLPPPKWGHWVPRPGPWGPWVAPQRPYAGPCVSSSTDPDPSRCIRNAVYRYQGQPTFSLPACEACCNNTAHTYPVVGWWLADCIARCKDAVKGLVLQGFWNAAASGGTVPEK